MSKFTYKDIEFEVNRRDYCDDCAYDGICENLKNPENIKNIEESFQDFCSKRLSVNQMPKEGTLEKNLPWIFPENKEALFTQEEESINQYCSNFCPYVCQGEQCPLYIHKKK